MSQKNKCITDKELMRHLEKMDIKDKGISIDYASVVSTEKSFNISKILLNFFIFIKYEKTSIFSKIDFSGK